MCFWVPFCTPKQPSARSLRGVWGLHPARWCEVRGWIPSPSLACWDVDLAIKHSEPSADSGARANLRPGCVFGCRFAPQNSTPRDQSGRLGLYLARLCEVRGWIPSSSLECWEGDLELKHSAPSADSGARANLRPGCVFGCRFACVNSPPRDQTEVAGDFTRRVEEELEVVSPQQVSRAGRETLK